MPSIATTVRRTSSIALAVSFLALASSGLLMTFTEGTTFTFRMHPAHNVFGLVMIVAGVLHVGLNWKPLVAHLRPRGAKLLGLALAAVLLLLFGVGLAHDIPPEAAGAMTGRR